MASVMVLTSTESKAPWIGWTGGNARRGVQERLERQERADADHRDAQEPEHVVTCDVEPAIVMRASSPLVKAARRRCGNERSAPASPAP